MLRTNERWVAAFPAADYNELAKFFDTIFKADRSQIVFVKKDS